MKEEEGGTLHLVDEVMREFDRGKMMSDLCEYNKLNFKQQYQLILHLKDVLIKMVV